MSLLRRRIIHASAPTAASTTTPSVPCTAGFSKKPIAGAYAGAPTISVSMPPFSDAAQSSIVMSRVRASGAWRSTRHGEATWAALHAVPASPVATAWTSCVFGSREVMWKPPASKSTSPPGSTLAPPGASAGHCVVAASIVVPSCVLVNEPRRMISPPGSTWTGWTMRSRASFTGGSDGRGARKVPRPAGSYMEADFG